MHQPLARMTYPSFLFHSLMVFAQIYGQQTVVFISWTKMVDYFTSIVISVDVLYSCLCVT